MCRSWILYFFLAILSLANRRCFCSDDIKKMVDLEYSEKCAKYTADTCKSNCSNDFYEGMKMLRKELKKVESFSLEHYYSSKKIASCSKYAPKNVTRPRNCDDLKTFGRTKTGVYSIYPFPNNPERAMKVYCDQETEGGGWAVIIYRNYTLAQKSHINFYNRSFADYVKGFGDFKGEFFIGLDKAFFLTQYAEALIDLEDIAGKELKPLLVNKCRIYGAISMYAVECHGPHYWRGIFNGMRHVGSFAMHCPEEKEDYGFQAPWWYDWECDTRLNLMGDHFSPFTKERPFFLHRGTKKAYILSSARIMVRPEYDYHK